MILRHSLKTYATALLVISVPLVVVAQGQKTEKANANEQSLFSAENESVDRPAALPESALEAIRRAEKATLDNLNPEALLASAIHLDGPKESDLIMIGVDGLRGAHIVPFWVLRKTNRGYEVVLDNRGDGLKVLDTKWKGYRTIETYNFTSGVVQTMTYRFDGSRYRRAKVTSSLSH